MRRRTFDALLSTAGLVLAIVLAVAGGLLYWGHSFASGHVYTELANEKIYFPAKGSAALTANPEIEKNLSPYAGQQLTTGRQAEVYADHFIKVHLSEVANGQTYAQVSSKIQQLKATNPNSSQLATLQGEQQTLFQGETLRGLLLNAYAFGKLGQIAFIASLAAFSAAGLMLLLSLLGFWHLRRAAPDEELLARLSQVELAASRR